MATPLRRANAMHAWTSAADAHRAIACGRSPSKRVLYRTRAASYTASAGRMSVPRSCAASELQSGGPTGDGAADRVAVAVAVAVRGGGVGLGGGRPRRG